MPLHSDLRIDTTAIYNDDNKDYLTIINFNFPVEIIRDNNRFDTLARLMADWLETRFGGTNLSFQLTASFLLVHTETGEQRQFTGSFNPRSNQVLSLEGEDFSIFTRDLFLRHVFNNADEDVLRQKLTRPENNSKWEYHSLVSFIVSCQVSLRANHAFLVDKQLTTPNRRRIRKQHTFTIFEGY